MLVTFFAIGLSAVDLSEDTRGRLASPFVAIGSEAWLRYNRYVEERNIDPHVEEA